MITIRLAQESGLGSIQKVIETAFSDEENKVISNFAADLSKETTSPPIKSLLAEVGIKVIGYVCYSPIFLNQLPASLDIFLLHLLCLQNIKNKVSVQTS